MPLLFHPTGGPGDGLFPMTHRVDATNRTGATLLVGEGVQFDLALGTDVDDLTPGSTDATDGDNTSGWNNVIAPNASSLLGLGVPTIFGFNGGRLGTAGIPADNALSDIIYYGFGAALMIDGSGNTVVGGNLTIDANGAFPHDPSAAEMLIAKARVILVTPTAATIGNIFLFGTFFGMWPLTAHT